MGQDMRGREVQHALRERPGFTVIELLVVIAIIGVLIALLLSAVQTAREAARRMQCADNLKQIGVALHNYHDTYHSFPPAMVAVYGLDTVYTKLGNWGWGAMLLPFIEQHALHDGLGVGKNRIPECIDDARMRELLKTPLPGFHCPSSADFPETNSSRLFDGFVLQDQQLTTSSYVGCNGSQGPFQAFTGYPARPEARGVFYLNSSTRFADIKDGTSTTFAVGERAWIRKCGSGCRRQVAAVVFGARGCTERSWWGMSDVVATGGFRLNYMDGNEPRAARGFSSDHPGGANFLFCDGSVRFVSETIERNNWSSVDTTWEKLCAMADGKPLNWP